MEVYYEMFNLKGCDPGRILVRSKSDLMSADEQEQLASEEELVPSVDDIFDALLSTRRPKTTGGSK